MIKIVCRTNVDKYTGSGIWPELEHKPVIGETIKVDNQVTDFFRNKNLPIRVEVVDVTHETGRIIVELHYKKIDLDIAAQNGVQLF